MLKCFTIYKNYLPSATMAVSYRRRRDYTKQFDWTYQLNDSLVPNLSAKKKILSIPAKNF